MGNALFLFADNVTVTPTQITQNVYAYSRVTQLDYLKLTDADQQSIATTWNVSSTDYAHYLWLMENTPAGKWYADLNPAEVLGLYAKDDKTRLHYAKIIVKNTFERTTRELALQQAYNEAWHELYPTLKPIEYQKSNFTHSNKLSLQAGDQLLLFISPDGEHFSFDPTLSSTRQSSQPDHTEYLFFGECER